MKKELKTLRWRPRWVTHLGCIKGCLEYLGVDVSDAWMFGATGHAFVLNIHDVVCPSGPTAWRTEMLFKLGRNIGYTTDGVLGFKSESDFAEKQEQAWQHARSSIDAGIPCYGWELDVPEYYVVYGYDDEGYYFSGPLCDESKNPKPWKELGDTEIGVLEMYSIKKTEPTDDITVVKQALEFALELADSPSKWILPKYRAGLGGFDNWMHAVQGGTAHGFGMAYNAAVWGECREFAVDFLREAKERIDGTVGSAFDEALGHYEVVAKNLHALAEAFPFPPKGEEIEDEDRRAHALKHLKDARQAEESGLRALRKIIEQL
jgi:hypothetical protein